MNIEDLKTDKKILVIGHKNPDSDTILSSYLMANILKSYKIDADYAVIDGEVPSDGSFKIINEVIDYNPYILKDINNFNYFLVDHNDVNQSVMDASLVLAAIDHHPNCGQISNAYFTKYCSTTLGIYALFKNVYKFSDEEKMIIYMGAVDDSSFGKSCRYKDVDKKLIEEMGFSSNLEIYFNKYFVPTDITNIDYAFNNNGLKHYDFDGIKFKSVYIEYFGIDKLNELKNFIKNNKENIYGLWIDFKNNHSYTFLKYNNLYLEKEYDYIVSRATVGLNDTLEYLRSKL